PGIGFELRNNFKSYSGRLFYGIHGGETSPLLRKTAAVESWVIIDNTQNEVETIRISSSWKYDYKNEAELKFAARLQYEHLFEPFDLFSEITVPVGEYTFYQAEASYSTADSRQLDLSFY